MSVDAVKLFRPQDGDIIVVDHGKVNVTQVEDAVKDLKVPVISVPDIDKIKLVGLREQKDFTQENAQLQLDKDAALKEVARLNRVIKDDMIPKPQMVAPSVQTSVNQTSAVPMITPIPTVSK